MTWNFSYLQSSVDQTKIRFAQSGNLDRPSRRIVIVGGRTEWIEKYSAIREKLGLEADCQIVTWDHRGQGASEGQRGHVDSYDLFANDMRQVLDATVPKDAPFVLIAHSMGALISLYTMFKFERWPEKMILLSPLLLIPEDTMPRELAFIVSGVFSFLGLGKRNISKVVQEAVFADNTLTHSQESYDLILKTPYRVPSPTFGWVYATLKASRAIFAPKNLKRLGCPTLVLGGSDEEVVDPRAFKLWVERAAKWSQQKVVYQEIAGARHELLFESEPLMQDALKYIRAW
jgi:lysophospholipase